MTRLAVILEGVSGAGKTTQARMLAARLRRFVSVSTVGEFSRGRTGLMLRNAYQQDQRRFISLHATSCGSDMTPLVILADTIAKAEAVNLSSADIVVVDRLIDSWLCYTLLSRTRHVMSDAVSAGLHRAFRETWMDASFVTVYLKVAPATATRRLALRDARIPRSAADERQLRALSRLFDRVCAGARTIDANGPASGISDQIAAEALTLLERTAKR